MSKEAKKAYRATCSMTGFAEIGLAMEILKETEKCYMCGFSGGRSVVRIMKEDIGNVRYVGENDRWPRLVTEVISDDSTQAELEARDLFIRWFEKSLENAGGRRAVDIEWDADGHEDELPKEIVIPWYVLKNGTEAVSDYISEQTGFCHKGFRLVKYEVCQVPYED